MATELEEFQLPSIIFGRETKGRLPLVVDGVSFKYGNGVTVQTFWFFLRHVIRREGLSWLVESITHSPAAVTFDRSLISAFLSARHQFRISRSKVKTNILTFFNLMIFFFRWSCSGCVWSCCWPVWRRPKLQRFVFPPIFEKFHFSKRNLIRMLTYFNPIDCSRHVLQLCFWVRNDLTKRLAVKSQNVTTPSIGIFLKNAIFGLKLYRIELDSKYFW